MIDFRPLSDDHPDLAYSPLLNVINVEGDHGTTERALFAAFFGEEHDWGNAGSQALGHLHDRPLGVALDQQVGLGIHQHRPT